MLYSGKQIKRNVVSLITKKESGTLPGILLTGVVALLIICCLMPVVSVGANLEIRQEVYRYQLPFAQVISAETFVIATASRQDEGTGGISQKIAQYVSASSAVFTNPILVHFQIDSLAISPNEKDKLFSQIQEFKVSPNAPLTVTGFTCKMGPAEFNDWLSEERAKAVAELLEKEGYTVSKIQGKGASDLISEHYSPLNRRVEVTFSAPNTAYTGQSKFSPKEEIP